MEDMSDLIKQFSEIIEKDGIPDNLKDILGNLNSDKSNHDDSEEDKKDDSSSSGFNFDGIDINTILKLQGMMSKMNKKDDPRSQLLMSLKTYLKDSRKGKIEQYIQFLNMAKMMDAFKETRW